MNADKQVDLFAEVSKHAATIVALKVNELVNKSAASSLLRRLDIEVGYYENGREHGFKMVCAETNKQVSFSEHRSSDAVIVYFGSIADFDEDGIISEEKYRTNCKSFKPDEKGYTDAAKFIIMHMGKRG